MRAKEPKQIWRSDIYNTKKLKEVPKTYLDYLHKSTYSQKLKDFGEREFINNYNYYE